MPGKTSNKKGGIAQHITLKCKKTNLVTYLDDPRINTDPDRASEYAIRKHQRAFPINYNQDLFNVASYPQGHYLVYDNAEVVAYTIIFA